MIHPACAIGLPVVHALLLGRLEGLAEIGLLIVPGLVVRVLLRSCDDCEFELARRRAYTQINTDFDSEALVAILVGINRLVKLLIVEDLIPISIEALHTLRDLDRHFVAGPVHFYVLQDLVNEFLLKVLEPLNLISGQSLESHDLVWCE